MDKFNDNTNMFPSILNNTDSQIAGLIQQLQSKIIEEDEIRFEDEKSPSENEDELSDTNTLSSSNFEEVGNDSKIMTKTSDNRDKEFIHKKRPRKNANKKKKHKSHKKQQQSSNNEKQYFRSKKQ